MNMKKLFTMMAVCLCGTMAYAQTSAISAKDVTIAKGGSCQMEVVIDNATSNTAFQFDLKLPAKVSVKEAQMKGSYGTSRVLQSKLIDETNNIYRFLSYDNGNATLTSEGNGVIITLGAEADAETGTATLNGEDMNLVVNPAGESTTQTAGDLAGITVAESVKITFGSSGATTYVGDADLDFTNNLDMTAYVIIGKEGTSLWLARVKTVPAGTPIFVKATSGGAGDYYVAKTTLSNIYYKSLLVGNNTDAAVSVTPEGTDQYFFLSTLGFQPFTEARNIGAHKAYVRVPALPAAKAGDAWPLTIGDAGMTTLCVDVDLDFSDQADVRAFTVMGYNNGSLWIAPVKHVSAGTPLFIRGPKGNYSITSSAVQTQYTNMLVGNNTDAAITIHPTDGDYTNMFLSTSGFSTFTEDRTTGAHKSYLQVLTSYKTAATRGNGESTIHNFIEAEVTRSIIDGVDADDETTGISRVAAQSGKDVWYNLNGQRIDTPTRKGLYIKNGKKVIVK